MTRKRVWLVVAAVAALAVAAVLSGCGGGSSAPAEKTGSSLSGEIEIAGSDTMVNVAQAWADGFMKENPDVTIAVKGGGSGVGIAALINGTVTFADASREMKPEEIKQAEGKGITPKENVVGYDGIAVIINPANKVEGLTKDQLGKIYRGEITNWKDVGGADAKIVLLSRDNSSGTYEFFKEKIVGKDKEYAKTAKLLPATQAIVDETKGNADAIGYVGIGYVSPDVKVVKLDGVAATIDTVKDKSYELARGLYMYSNGEPKDAAAAYLTWILSPAGQKILTDEGFVPVK